MRRAILALGFWLSLAPSLAAQPAEWRLEWPETDFARHSVPYHEIISGGPPKDGIPSIDDPAFVPVAEAELADNEPVIGVVIDGDARAYPLRILIWHEIVNDVVGGVPVAVTYCPLCNTGIVFDRRVADRVLEFGTTGKLRNSDLVMYDRTTESWWQQFLGEAIVGELTGTRLTMLPSRLESFANFKERAPDGRVQVRGRQLRRAYGANPYAGYDSAPGAVSVPRPAACGHRPARPRRAGRRPGLEPRSGAREGAARGGRPALHLGGGPGLGPRREHRLPTASTSATSWSSAGPRTAGRMPSTRSTSRSLSTPSIPRASFTCSSRMVLSGSCRQWAERLSPVLWTAVRSKLRAGSTALGSA